MKTRWLKTRWFIRNYKIEVRSNLLSNWAKGDMNLNEILWRIADVEYNDQKEFESFRDAMKEFVPAAEIKSFKSHNRQYYMIQFNQIEVVHYKDCESVDEFEYVSHIRPDYIIKKDDDGDYYIE